MRFDEEHQVAKDFLHYDLDQPLLFQTDIRTWLPEDHIAIFISDIIESMKLTEIFQQYKMGRGKPGYDPRLLLKILIYGYSKGIRSSRRLEQATFEDVAFRILAANNHPDHDTIASFRARHIQSINSVFLEILELCKKAKLLKCNHLSLDGTKIRASANKSKSKNYNQLLKSKEELQSEIQKIMQEAEEIDKAEDKKYGKGKRGDELPEALKNKTKRKAAIEKLLNEIRQEAEEKKDDYPKKKEKMKTEDDQWMEENGLKFERRAPKNPLNKPVEKIIESRRNPTDYDSRVMKSGISGGFIQGYNCQAAVDEDSQIIIAAQVSNQTNDKGLIRPMIEKSIENLNGQAPNFFTGDNGYYSERDIVWIEKKDIDPYIPPSKQDKGKRLIKTVDGMMSITEFMRFKLKSDVGKSIYRKRKTITEPVFGQMKNVRGFRNFLTRGLQKVNAEWQLISIAHNIGKLHKLGYQA